MEIGKFKLAKAYLVRPPKKPTSEFLTQEQAEAKSPGLFNAEVNENVVTKNYEAEEYINRVKSYVQSKYIDEDFARRLIEKKLKDLEMTQSDLDTSAINFATGGRVNRAIGGGAIEGEDLGTREGFRRPMIPVSKLPKDQQKFINNWLKNNPDKTWEDLTNLQRNDLKKGKNVGVGYGGSTPKGVDNPAFQPLSEKGKKIAQHVYGTTDITNDQRQRINRGEITMDTKPVKFQKGKDISVKMKRGASIADDVVFPNEQMKKDFIKAIKARVKQPQKAVVDFSNKELSQLFPISEKQAGRAAQYFIKDLGLEYAKVKTKTASEIIKNTKNLIKQTSSFLQENRIRSAKTDILQDLDLQKKMDTAHRVSKTHMAKLGLQFNTDIMGIDSRLINQIIVKPSEVQLDRLYRKQYDIFEKLKKNPDSIELKNILKDINKEVTNIVKSTSGRLVGVTIDPDTLEPSFQGIKKKYSFSNVLGDSMTMKELENLPKEDQVKFLTKQLPKAIDLEVKRGFVPNDFKNILSNPNSQKAILNYAKQKAPELIDPLKKAFLNPTSKISLKLFSQFPAIATTGLVGLGVYKGMGFDQEVRADDMSTPVDPGVPVQQQEQFDPERADPTLTTALGAGAVYKYGPQLLKILKNIGLKPLGSVTAGLGYTGAELASDDPSYGLASANLFLPEITGAASKAANVTSKAGRFLLNPFTAISPSASTLVPKIMTRAAIPLTIGGGIMDIAKASQPDYLLDKETGEPKAFERKDASFVMPTMIDANEQVSRFAKEKGISYQDAFKELFKDKTFREGIQETVQKYANGGRIGFADGPEDPGKRKFMKIMGGLASLPIVGRLFDVAQVAEKAAPAVVETFKNAPPHFIGLVNKIRALGKIVDPKKLLRSEQDRYSNVYDYGEYRMFERTDGQVEIQKQKLMATDYGDGIVSDEYMSYDPKRPKFNKKGEKIPDEYEEVYEENTTYADQYGEMQDVREGVEPETINDGTFSKEELEQLIIEQIEDSIKKGKK